MGEQEGLTRRQLLRAGTLAGATVAWIAPSTTVHAMTSSLAEATSGERQPPPEDSPSEEPSENQPETPDNDTPRSDDDPSDDIDAPEKDDSSDDRGVPKEDDLPIEVSDSEIEAPTEPGVTEEATQPRPPEVAVEDNGITAEAPRPPGNPSVNPPPVIAAQQSELPQTGIDADVLTGIGASLTALGAAALRASKKPETD